MPSLVLGCEKSNPSVHKNYSMLYSSHISWSSPTTPTPLELYPALAFDRLFKDEVQRGDQSVLDAVLADAQDLRRGISVRRSTQTGRVSWIRCEMSNSASNTRGCVANCRAGGPRNWNRTSRGRPTAFPRTWANTCD